MQLEALTLVKTVGQELVPKHLVESTFRPVNKHSTWLKWRTNSNLMTLKKTGKMD